MAQTVSPPEIQYDDEDEVDALARQFLMEIAADYADDVDMMVSLVEEMAAGPERLRELMRYKYMPVGIREFIESAAYMNAPGIVWPKVMDELEKINDGTREEVVFTGGIGTAKTTGALYSQAYQLYLLSCLRNPHKEFGLDPASEILIVFQSLNLAKAEDLDYARFREMIKKAPYFQENFRFSEHLESEMQFPNRIIVRPIAGSAESAIGENVISAIIDEINFMAVISKSKNSHDGGIYDQAVRNYNALARRRESRFLKQGRLPGLLCLVSSRNYPGQFTDVKEQEAKTNPRIYVYDKRQWEVRPEFDDNGVPIYSGKKFKLFLGDATRRPRILSDGDSVAKDDQHLVLMVPVEHRAPFESDMLSAIRDIAGHSTFALHPYILEPEKVRDCFETVESVLSRESCDFKTTRVNAFKSKILHSAVPRFVHIDFGLTSDSCGVACGYVPRFVEVQRQKEYEVLPEIQFDFVLEVPPPRGGEIQFESVRELLYNLRELGLPIKWVSLDSWQSTDTRQILQRRGFTTGIFSLDTDPRGYDTTKQALYDGRVKAPKHEKAMMEFIRLERDPVTRKIDHPPKFSKDCSDAMAGVVFGLSSRREIWAKHGLAAAMPKRLQVAAPQTRDSGEVGAARLSD